MKPKALFTQITPKTLKVVKLLAFTSIIVMCALHSNAQCPNQFFLHSVDPMNNPPRFKWETDCNIKHWELQVLRLYNIDTNKTDPHDIYTEVDWGNALSYILSNTERDSSNLSVQRWICDWLTLPEGSGFYIWRLRASDSAGKIFAADPVSWTPWSNHAPFTQGYTGFMNDAIANSNVHAFYYDALDENINWVYKRRFLDLPKWDFRSTQINESIDYADYLLMPIQHQKQVHENLLRANAHAIVSATVIDNSGRPSLKSLPIPGPEWLEYQQSYFQNSNGMAFKSDNFDNENNYNNPGQVANDFSFYYSDANQDKRIAPAYNRPYSRVLYYNDGQNRPREISSSGYHMPDPTNNTNKSTANTIRKFYDTPFDDEVIMIFGDEAPEASFVSKVITEDPNGVWTVAYYDEQERLIASCYSTPVSNRVDNTGNVNYVQMSLHDTIRGRIDVAPDLLVAKTTKVVSKPNTPIGYYYRITPQKYYNECIDFCATCDYNITIRGKERDEPLTYTDDLNVPMTLDSTTANCTPGTSSMTGSYEIPTSSLDVGTYDFSATIELGNKDANGKPYLDSALNVVHRNLDNKLSAGGWVAGGSYPLKIDSMRFYANLEDWEGLMTYLNVDTSQPTFDIVFVGTCDTITLPTVKCKPNKCDTPLFAEYMKEQLQLDDIKTGTSFFADAYANNTTNGIAFTTDTANLFIVDTDQEFNDIIGRMIDDGYDCNDLWSAWKQTVDIYINGQKSLYPGATALRDTMLKYDWWGYFMGVAGYKFALTRYDYSDLFVTTSQVRLKPYRNFPYTWGTLPALEEVYCYMYTQSLPCSTTTWRANINNFPGQDPYNVPFHMYNFYRNIKTQNYLTVHTKLNGGVPVSPNPNDLPAYVHYTCIEGCEYRLDRIVKDVAYNMMDEWKLEVESFKYDLGWRPASVGTASLDEVYCMANAVVEQCKSMCDVTPDSSGYFSAAKQLDITKALVYDVSVYTKPSGITNAVCPAGYDSVQTPTMQRMAPIMSKLKSEFYKVKDSLTATNTYSYYWHPFASGSSLFNNTALASPPCDDANILILSTDHAYEFSFGTAVTHDENVCGVNTFRRLTYDSIYTNWITTVELQSTLSSDLATGDSIVITETIPSGFTYVSSYGNYNSGQIRYVVYGPMYTGDTISLPYKMKSPSTAGTYSFNGSLERYTSGTVTQACSLWYGHDIVVNDCIPLYVKIWRNPVDFYVYSLCGSVCQQLDSCDFGLCLKWEFTGDGLDTLADSTIKIKSCGFLVCANFLSTLDYSLYQLHKKYEDDIRQQYNDKCRNKWAINDLWTHTMGIELGQFTLFFYDRAGNLTRKVMPKGADPSTSWSRMSLPNRNYRSEYDYDTRGQLSRQFEPDGGNTHYYYNIAGQLLRSTDATQSPSGGTYYQYDALGRVVEIFSTGAGPRTTIRYTTPYTTDYPSDPKLPIGSGPLTSGKYQNELNLYNRISYTIVDNDGDISTTDDKVVNVYSYDPHGNVELFYQYSGDMPNAKLIKYDNGIFSSNVNALEILDIGGGSSTDDAIKIFYEYNRDGKPEYVFIDHPNDPNNPRNWDYLDINSVYDERVAAYTFNPHDDNQLRRIEYGDNIQGIDYTYTIEGWLKAINHPIDNDDPGTDMYIPDPNAVLDGSDNNMMTFNKDVFSEVLHYYSGDFFRVSSQFNNDNKKYIMGNDLYNGVVAGMQTQIKNHQSGPMDNFDRYTVGNTYEYDPLYRLKKSEFNWYDDTATGVKWRYTNPHILGSSNGPYEYDETFSYDKNGNLSTLKRWAPANASGYPATTGLGTPVLMDNLTYVNGTTDNKLQQVQESNNAGRGDLPDDVSFLYDAKGRTIRYTPTTIEKWQMSWRYDDKIDVMTLPGTSGQQRRYLYDAMGNRTAEYKYDWQPGGWYQTDYKNYYLFTPDGKILAKYTVYGHGGNMNTMERYIYGTSRIGYINGPNSPSGQVRGGNGAPDMLYEVNDHLGNVRAVIDETQTLAIPPPNPVGPVLYAQQDYYSFGSLKNDRVENAASSTFGFNGQQKNENIIGNGASTKGLLNHAKYWEYMTQLGRRFHIGLDMVATPGPGSHTAESECQKGIE